VPTAVPQALRRLLTASALLAVGAGAALVFPPIRADRAEAAALARLPEAPPTARGGFGNDPEPEPHRLSSPVPSALAALSTAPVGGPRDVGRARNTVPAPSHRPLVVASLEPNTQHPARSGSAEIARWCLAHSTSTSTP
jgi:hypothetical protein